MLLKYYLDSNFLDLISEILSPTMHTSTNRIDRAIPISATLPMNNGNFTQMISKSLDIHFYLQKYYI